MPSLGCGGCCVLMQLLLSLLLWGCGAQNQTQQAGDRASLADMAAMDSTVWFKEQGALLSPTSQGLLRFLATHQPSLDTSLARFHTVASCSADTALMALDLGFHTVDFFYLLRAENQRAAAQCLVGVDSLLLCMGLTDVWPLTALWDSMTAPLSWAQLMQWSLPRVNRLSEQLHRLHRKDLYALIAAAAWVEGTHLLGHLALENESQVLYQLMAEQRLSLTAVTDVLAECVYSSPDCEQIYSALSGLLPLYQSVQISYSYQAPKVDTAARLTCIQGTMQVSMSKAQLEAIVSALTLLTDQLAHAIHASSAR